MSTTYRKLLTALALVVVFAVSFAFMYWQRQTANQPVLSAATAIAPQAPATAIAPPPPQRTAAGVRESAVPIKGPANAAPAPADTPNTDGPAMPVMFDIVPNTVYVKEEGADGVARHVHKNVNDGVIFNQSDQSLTVTAIEVNIATQKTSRTEFVLGQGNQKHFGTDDGLDMVSGDQLTLRSPSYRDLTKQIP